MQVFFEFFLKKFLFQKIAQKNLQIILKWYIIKPVCIIHRKKEL